MSSERSGVDIDPVRKNVATGKKPRKPWRRNVPKLLKNLAADKAAYEDCAQSRPFSLGVMLEYHKCSFEEQSVR